jgi:hypothetical protein
MMGAGLQRARTMALASQAKRFPAVGEWYMDRDTREMNRVMEVTAIAGAHAVLTSRGGHHQTKIRLDRLAKAWRLVDPVQ